MEFVAREEMNDSHSGGRWKFLKGKLRLKSMTCCSGGIWGLGAASSNMRVREEEDDDLEMQLTQHIVEVGPTNDTTNGRNCVPRSTSGINLAMALAAERHYRAAQDCEVGPSSSSNSSRSTSNNATTTATPMRVSLMRLLEEGDGLDFDEDDDFEEDEEEESEKGKDKKGGLGSDVVCCVCMRRKKGAAFIPCGHTFCRVCSRELWLNRGSCPLCNRSILEILDIF